MKLDEFRVVLTGASGGIGAAIARELAAAGASLLLVGRNARALGHLAAELPAGHRIAALPADITRAEGRAAIRDAAAPMRVNALINCAGLPCFGALDHVNDARIAAVLITNLVAPIQLTRTLLPQLIAQPQARVLNVGSVLGRLALPGHSVYCAGKFGLRGFSESLRRELAATSVRVQYLGPRATRTAFNDAQAEAFNRATAARVDDPARVAQVAVRLLASGAAERFLGFTESIAARVNGVAPSLLDGSFKPHAAALAAAMTIPNP